MIKLGSDIILIGDKQYTRLSLNWFDICGDATISGPDEFAKLKICSIHTEGYLYSLETIDGREVVKTFASYQCQDDIGFGDRNVYPMEVFSADSQKKIRKAWKKQSNE
jgi:hypothetical protein